MIVVQMVTVFSLVILNHDGNFGADSTVGAGLP